MGFIKEFKTFLFQKDIVSVAVAFIIAAGFKVIIDSFVNDLIMPVAGLLTGGVDFTQKFISLDGQHYATLDAAKAAEAAVITYGNFIQAIINFVIIGLVVFMVVKGYEKTKKKEEAAPVALPASEVLLAEIRDLLKNK